MPAQRFGFIDNMRLAMIVLVVCLHSAITYSGLGGWYYKEPTDLPQAEHLGFLVGQCFLQAFFMGALFMLAGHFAADRLPMTLIHRLAALCFAGLAIYAACQALGIVAL